MRLAIALLRKHCNNQQQWIGRTVMVENNDVESAMKVLNGIMAQEGLYQRWMGTRRYETPTVARRRINFQRGKAVYHEDMDKRIQMVLRNNRKDPYPGTC